MEKQVAAVLEPWCAARLAAPREARHDCFAREASRAGGLRLERARHHEEGTREGRRVERGVGVHRQRVRLMVANRPVLRDRHGQKRERVDREVSVGAVSVGTSSGSTSAASVPLFAGGTSSAPARLAASPAGVW